MEDKVRGSNISLIGVPGKKSRGWEEQRISVTNVTQQPQTYQFKINQCILLTIVSNLGLELGRAQLGSPQVECLIGLVSDVSSDYRHLKAPAGIKVQEVSLIWGVTGYWLLPWSCGYKLELPSWAGNFILSVINLPTGRRLLPEGTSQENQAKVAGPFITWSQSSYGLTSTLICWSKSQI